MQGTIAWRVGHLEIVGRSCPTLELYPWLMWVGEGQWQWCWGGGGGLKRELSVGLILKENWVGMGDGKASEQVDGER